MNDADVAEWFSIVMSTSPECADRAELGVVVGAASRLESFLAHYKVRCARRSNELAAEGRAEGGFGLIASEGHQSARDAQAAVDRDRVCTELPELDDALASGAVSGDHLDIVAKHTKNLTDDERAALHERGRELADAAAAESTWSFERRTKQLINAIKSTTRPNSDVEEYERQRAASRIRRSTDRVTGMKTTVIELDPIRDAKLHNQVAAELTRLKRDAANQGRPFHELQVEAMLAVLMRPAARSGNVNSSGNGGAGPIDGPVGVPEIIAITDAATLDCGRHPNTICETVDGDPIPVATVQRFCCEAAITAVAVNPDGSVAQVREERTANRRQRRALAALYATCAHPDCTMPFSQCRIHHIIWWTNGGTTTLDNLIPVCERHHHLVHEGGWNIRMDPDRTTRWERPDGTIWLEHHSPNRRPRSASPPAPPPPRPRATRAA